MGVGVQVDVGVVVGPGSGMFCSYLDPRLASGKKPDQIHKSECASHKRPVRTDLLKQSSVLSR